MDKFIGILGSILIIAGIFYSMFVWIHSVFVGRLDFDIFSKGEYKGVLFTLVVGASYYVIKTYYIKRKKKAHKESKNPARRVK